MGGLLKSLRKNNALTICNPKRWRHSYYCKQPEPHLSLFANFERNMWLPNVVASHSRQPQVIQLVVKMYIRRSKRILLSLVDPLPPEPAPRQPVYLNTIVEALKIRSFINDSPAPMTWDKTSKVMDISTSKIAHLLKIVNTRNSSVLGSKIIPCRPKIGRIPAIN